MDLSIQHGTRSKDEDVKDIWGYNSEVVKEEIARLRVGAEIGSVVTRGMRTPWLSGGRRMVTHNWGI